MKNFSILVFTTIMSLGIAQGTLAETWTGCVTPGGTIIHVTVGDAPLRPCRPRQAVIHLTDRASKQNTGATHDHELLCEALKNAGAAGVDLDNLGCPRGTEPLPDGAPMLVTPADLGPLMIDECDNASDYCFKVENSFVGKQFQVVNDEVDNNSPTGSCPAACEGDTRCFMAWLEAPGPFRVYPSLTCHLFYRSDTLGTTEHWCGDTEENCTRNNLNGINFFWYRVEQ